MKALTCLLGLISFISLPAFGQRDDRRIPGPGDAVVEDPFGGWQTNAQSFHFGWHSYRRPEQWNDNGTATIVSLKQLAHKIPKSALKEQRKGRVALDKHDYEVAREHLENALNIDSQFADAHNDLGVVIESCGHRHQAIPEFQKAVDLSPDREKAVANLSMALYWQGRYHEMCPVARRALKINPDLVHLRFLLALSLIADRGDATEALASLERAAPEFPEAHVIISNLLVKIGRREDAARELEIYLRSANKEQKAREQLQARIVALRR